MASRTDVGAARPAASAHRALLAISFAPDLAPAARDRLAARARRALALLCDGDPPRDVLDETDALVLEAGGAAPHRVAADGAFVRSFGVGGTDWRAARACDAERLLAALRITGAGALADYTPPFAAVFRTRHDAPLEAATDACGILHVYVTAGTGFAACSSSCLALGALGDAGLDLESLAVYARLGLYPDRRTPFAGVQRLQPGEVCALAAGAFRVRTWAEAPVREAEFTTFAQAVDAGAEILRAAVEAVATAHPRIGLSLSGGLDSRLVLAALPTARRAALEVLCLETVGEDDAPLVRRLARLCGFAPTVVDIGTFPRSLAAEWAEAASRRRDHCADALATAVLEWAEAALPATPRMHGQNGEFARGYYYRREPTEQRVTPERVDELLDRHGFKGAAARVLAPEYREPIEAMLRHQHYDWFAATGLPWLEATDEYYLRQRMAGWVGVELSRTSMRRIDLSPYFDPRFLAFARRLSARDRYGSRLAAAVLETLDPMLAVVPLDARCSPAELWRADTPPPRYPAGPRTPRVDPVGAAAAGAQVLADMASGRLSLARAAALPLFDAAALAAASSGDRPLGVASLGFALNVEWMLAFLEQARG